MSRNGAPSPGRSDGTLQPVKHVLGEEVVCTLCGRTFLLERSERWCPACVAAIIAADEVTFPL